MSALSHEVAGLDERVSSPTIAGKPQSVQSCDFRSAGRLSNENARALTAIHETLSRNLAGALAAYVGADLKIKLLELDQVPVRDYAASVPAFSYITSFPLSTVSSTLILQCDADLIFPIIDLLLGGTGVPAAEPRELSEIEEEIMQDLMTLIARQTERAWGMSDSPLSATARIEPGALNAVFAANEKATLVKFELETAGITGTFQLVFPGSLVNVLVKQSKAGQPQKKSALRFFPTMSIRERILDCDVTVAADLPSMRVSVRDLIGLQPGCVLKLRAPVRTPGMLTVGGLEIFEAVPVRNGTQKAAQVGRRVQPMSWGKE
jgi:flagellar motor switch protein FliM